MRVIAETGLVLATFLTCAPTLSGDLSQETSSKYMPISSTQLSLVRTQSGAATIYVGSEPFASADHVTLHGRFAVPLKGTDITNNDAKAESPLRVPEDKPEPTPTPSPRPRCIPCMSFVELDNTGVIRLRDERIKRPKKPTNPPPGDPQNPHMLPLTSDEPVIVIDRSGAATVYIGNEPFVSVPQLTLHGRFSNAIQGSGFPVVSERAGAKMLKLPEPTPTPTPRPGCKAIACMEFSPMGPEIQVIRVVREKQP